MVNKKKVSKKEILVVVAIIAIAILAVGYLIFSEVWPVRIRYVEEDNESHIDFYIPSSKIKIPTNPTDKVSEVNSGQNG